MCPLRKKPFSFLSKLKAFHTAVFISVLLHLGLITLFISSPDHSSFWGGGYGGKRENIPVIWVTPRQENGEHDAGSGSVAVNSGRSDRHVEGFHGEKGAEKKGDGFSPTPAGGKGMGYDAQNGGAGDTLSLIRQRIELFKHYPNVARKKGLTGVVQIVFRIGNSGQIDATRIVQSSGHAILDDEALATLKRAAPFPVYAGEILIPMKFDLNDRL